MEKFVLHEFLLDEVSARHNDTEKKKFNCEEKKIIWVNCHIQKLLSKNNFYVTIHRAHTR